MAFAIALLPSLSPVLLLDFDWFPTSIGLRSGWLCLSIEYDTASTVFFWLFFIPLYCAIPYSYALYVLYDIVVKQKLLPPRGRRRELAVYFFRIFICFALFWMPALVTMRVFSGVSSPWVVWSFGLIAHAQGLASNLLTLLKRDIRLAVQDFVSCYWGGRNNSNYSRRRREKRRRSSHIAISGEFNTNDDAHGGGRSSFFLGGGSGDRSSNFFGGGRSSNFLSTSGFSQYFRAVNGRKQDGAKQQLPLKGDSKSTFDVDLSNRQNALVSKSSSSNSDSGSSQEDDAIDLNLDGEAKAKEQTATRLQAQVTTSRPTPTFAPSSSTRSILQRMKRSVIESIFSSTNENCDGDLPDDADDEDDAEYVRDQDDISCSSSVSSMGLPRQLDDFRFEDEEEEIIFHLRGEDSSEYDGGDVEGEQDNINIDINVSDNVDGENNADATDDDGTIINA